MFTNAGGIITTPFPTYAPRAIEVPTERCGRHLAHETWNLVRRHGDDSIATERDERQGHGVIAADDQEAVRPVAQDRHDLLHVARGFLDTDDVRDLARDLQRR